MLKTRWDTIFGLLGKESGWELDSLPVADFGNVNLAGGATVRTLCASFPLSNPSHIIKSPDNHPFEEPGGTLAAASGDRQIGTGARPIALLLGAYLIRATAAGAVYLPATTTINVRVLSAAAGVGGAFTTLGTFNASAGTNFVESIPIIGTTGRFFSPEGLPNAAAAAIFDGDSLFVELVAAGVLNVQSNILAVQLLLA